MTHSELEEIHLRPYRPADLEDCMTIWTLASRAGHPFLSADDIAADAPLVRDTYMPMAEITVAQNGVRIAGFIAMVGDFIGGLFVAPEQHRRGIGRALVNHAAKHREHITVEVYQANAQARDFYRSLGFVETSRCDEDDRGRPYPLVRMENRASTTIDT